MPGSPWFQAVFWSDLVLVSGCLVGIIVLLAGRGPIEQRLPSAVGLAGFGLSGVWMLLVLGLWMFGWIPKWIIGALISMSPGFWIASAVVIRRRILAPAVK